MPASIWPRPGRAASRPSWLPGQASRGRPEAGSRAFRPTETRHLGSSRVSPHTAKAKPRTTNMTDAKTFEPVTQAEGECVLGLGLGRGGLVGRTAE